MSDIICIKAKSHSDFELYLISEKYDIPYDFLIDYKEDKFITKFWTEVGSGRIMAIEELESGKKNFIPILSMTPSELKLVKNTTPLISGKTIAKWKGDIELKQKEFNDMILKEEERKKQMLSRKYDINNIVCINTKLKLEAIFAICLSNDLDFIEVGDFIESNLHLDLNKVWYEKSTTLLVAWETLNHFDVNKRALVPKESISKMSRKAVVIPKIKVNDVSIDEYNKAKEFGFYLDIPKLENKEKYSSDIDVDSFSLDDLNNLLNIALENEDYESAAELRDFIKMKFGDL